MYIIENLSLNYLWLLASSVTDESSVIIGIGGTSYVDVISGSMVVSLTSVVLLKVTVDVEMGVVG